MDRSEAIIILPFISPYNWLSILDFLSLRAIPHVESVIENRYMRVVSVGSRIGMIGIGPLEGKNCLELTIRGLSTMDHHLVTTRVRRIFDLDANPAEISQCLGRDQLLSPLLKMHPGLRVPGAWDGFELTVRAIVGQQVSVRGATTMIGRLVEEFGTPLPSRQINGLGYLFPAAEDLASVDASCFKFPKSRAHAIINLAKAYCNGDVSYDLAQNLDEFRNSLTRIPGIGDWTAQYVAMRYLRQTDAFPVSDLGILAGASATEEKMKPAELLRRAEKWRPWRAYAAMYIWKRYASLRQGDTGR